MKRVWFAVVSTAFAAAAAAAVGNELACGADGPLSLHLRLEYRVTASRSVLSIAGDGAIVYRRQDDAYAMESSLQALGIFEAHQTSAGTVGRGGLVPYRFTQQTSRRAALTVDFDWNAQRVSFSQGAPPAPTRPQMQDRLSLLLQLPWRQRSEPQAESIELPVAGHRNTSTYVFDARGSETLDLPAGRFQALKFERRREAGDDTLEVWLAPALCSLPVRVRFSDDKGVVIEQQLRAVRPLP